MIIPRSESYLAEQHALVSGTARNARIVEESGQVGANVMSPKDRLKTGPKYIK